ncbi:hypothetical protein GCM10027298_35500 [Epidermidibacterium keratini]
MAQLLAADRLGVHITERPQAGKELAADAEPSDEIGQPLVRGVKTALLAQVSDRLSGKLLAVEVDLLRARVQEQVLREVGPEGDVPPVVQRGT